MSNNISKWVGDARARADDEAYERYAEAMLAVYREASPPQRLTDDELIAAAWLESPETMEAIGRALIPVLEDFRQWLEREGYA